MAREITTDASTKLDDAYSRENAPGRPELRHEKPLDRYTDRLFKYIPAEIVAVYVSSLGIIKSSSSGQEAAQILIFIILTLITPAYLYRVTNVRNKLQLLISTMSFIVWALSLGGPSDSIHLPPLYAALLLPVFTLLVAIIKPDSK